MNYNIDINEASMIQLNRGLLDVLLADRTTGKNILWATDEYASLGSAYQIDCEMKVDLILGECSVIQPRIAKEQDQREQRTREKAEVFTPSWICNAQNNLVDAQWFDRKDVFNCEAEKSWQTNPEKIVFPDKEGKSWQDYIDANRLEITCGEAPYLVSRYDTVTGDFIPIPNRIGLLDRKLRIVSENTKTESDWLMWTYRAFESVYGYDLQGDNVLLARENLLYTFIDYCQDHLKREPTVSELERVADIISWNIWQMNGLTMTAPYSKDENQEEQMTMFTLLAAANEPEEIPCVIRDWKAKENIIFKDLAKG